MRNQGSFKQKRIQKVYATHTLFWKSYFRIYCINCIESRMSNKTWNLGNSEFGLVNSAVKENPGIKAG